MPAPQNTLTLQQNTALEQQIDASSAAPVQQVQLIKMTAAIFTLGRRKVFRPKGEKGEEANFEQPSDLEE